MKIFFITFFFIILSFLVFFLWASYPWSLKQKNLQPNAYFLEPEVRVELPESPSVLKVLTFNLSFLYGKGSEGEGYVKREKDFYEKQLKLISQLIRDWEVDVVFLQEVDFSSSRSYGMNQAEMISRKAGLPYLALAPSWEANYIPFPYWPLSGQFGRMKSGGAILSKYPISSHEVILFEKPLSNPWWYNLFYLHRYVQKVTLTMDDKSFQLMNVHLEAFDKADRKRQILQLMDRIKHQRIHLVAGDFNMVPAFANKKSGFLGPSLKEENYENDESYDLMESSSLLEVIPQDIYQKEEARYFTFPSWSPDRRLDYLWYREDLSLIQAEVLSSATLLGVSDHLPLKASFQISGPKFNPYSQ